MIESQVFDELFVLEMANNHWGKLERGLKIVKDFSRIVRFNNVKAAIKIQLRDVDTFVHKDFRDRRDIRYIAKTLDTQMSREEFSTARSGNPAGRLLDIGNPLRRGFRRLLRRTGNSSAENRQLRHQRLVPDRGDRQNQEAGDCLHGRFVPEGHRRLGEFLRQPAYPLGHKPLRLPLPDRGRRIGTEPNRFSPPPLSQSRDRPFHARVPAIGPPRC